MPSASQVRMAALSDMALSSAAFTQDSKSVVVGSWDNNVYLYSVGESLSLLFVVSIREHVCFFESLVAVPVFVAVLYLPKQSLSSWRPDECVCVYKPACS